MYVPAAELHDDVVTLRRWRAEDRDVLLAAVAGSIDHLARWMPWASDGYTEQDAVRYLESCRTDWDRGETFNYAIVAPDGVTAGSCGLMTRFGPGALEIGYWLTRERSGNGLATRAAALLTDEAFRVGADRVVIVHDDHNDRSRAIPVRLEFTELGTKPRPGGGTNVVWWRAAPR